MRLEGRVAIVTGAGSGIGAASAERFAAEGAHVVAVDRDGDAAAAVAARLRGRATAAAVDVCDDAAVRTLVQATADDRGRLDVVFSNAGVPERVKPLAEIDRAEWDAVLAVNLTAFFTLAQAAVPRMTRGGSLLVTASIAARRPRPGMAAYVASKAGVIGLARALAIELAPAGIRVNVVNPGPAMTPMLAEFGFGADAEERLAAALPLGAAIEPSDIAAAAVHLCSDEARRVTGVVHNVDSGRDL